MTVFNKRLMLACLATVLTTAGTANASTIYYFANITNTVGNPNVAGQLSVEVSDEGTIGSYNYASFKFLNNVGTASSITDIYFQDGTLLGISSITDSDGAGTGVAFAAGANPQGLPGGNGYGFTPTATFSLDSQPGRPGVLAKGVNSSSEWVTVTFQLLLGVDFDDTLAALASGALKIGLHVQGIDNGGSDSFVAPPPNVPDGGMTISLLGLALTGIGLLGRRHRS